MLLPFSGTEMRQSTMYDPTGTTPNALKESLEDPGRRRWHLIDGDIEQINISACFVLPPIDGTTGKVIPSECGGRRRVDYVLTRKEDKVVRTSHHLVNAPSQWETMLHCNIVSHWLGAYTKLSLHHYGFWFNILKPEQNHSHFSDDILKCIFLNENRYIFIQISLKFVPKGLNNSKSGLVQAMAWHRVGDKSLP